MSESLHLKFESVGSGTNACAEKNVVVSTDMNVSATEMFPLVSVLLNGQKDTNEEIEKLVRAECSRQNVDIPKDSTSRLSYVRFWKPVFDRVLALLSLVLFFPLCLPIAVAIKLSSPGPIFFVQQRTGYLGRRFSLIKFRTMVHNAEELKGSLISENVFSEDSPDFKLKKDPRVTAVGAFLRKTSLDELPNLINVLRGDMSLIGPRPTSFKPTTYRQNHLPRLAAMPGLTGLWQVSGRADVDFDDRTLLDVQYINDISIWEDSRILWETVAVILRQKGAY